MIAPRSLVGSNKDGRERIHVFGAQERSKVLIGEEPGHAGHQDEQALMHGSRPRDKFLLMSGMLLVLADKVVDGKFLGRPFC
jgi:hypothetical protein